MEYTFLLEIGRDNFKASSFWNCLELPLLNEDFWVSQGRSAISLRMTT